MQLPSLFVLGTAVLSGITVGACRRSSAEPRPLDPPYVVVDGELRVRPDIERRLRFTEVSAAPSHGAIRGFGRVAFAPDAAYAVRSPSRGFVEQVHVTIGQEVRAGQPLATVRSSDVARLRAEARRLESTIAAEDDGVRRIERLIVEGAASPRELVEAKGRRDALVAELAGVRDALSAQGVLDGSGDRFVVRASRPGHVLARSIAPGERLSTDTAAPAFLVGDGTRLLVRAMFPERDLPLLQNGAACRFVVPALGTSEMAGALANVVRTVDPKTHTAEAFCVPNAVDARLAVDMTAKVEVDVSSRGGVTVPRSAVLLRRDDRVVFVALADGVLQRRSVQLGAAVGDLVQVVHGLAPGERVVVENAVLLDGELDRLL